jgi:hypothetical protein
MRLIYLILGVALITGCATSIPQAENFPQSTQKNVMAAQHWNAIAKDAVERTRLALNNKGFPTDTPLYISENPKTAFDQAFRKYMISNLIAAGAVVSIKEEGAIIVNYETQVIKHASSFEPEKSGYKPGVATAGVTSFWIIRDVFKGLNALNGLGTVAMAGAYDGYQAHNPDETGVELLLTTSITHHDYYVMLNADAYYIENGEAWLFEECKGRSRRYCK